MLHLDHDHLTDAPCRLFPRQTRHHRCRRRCGTRWGSCRCLVRRRPRPWWSPQCVPQGCPLPECGCHTAHTQRNMKGTGQSARAVRARRRVQTLTSFFSNSGISLLTSMTLMTTLQSTLKPGREKLWVGRLDAKTDTHHVHHTVCECHLGRWLSHPGYRPYVLFAVACSTPGFFQRQRRWRRLCLGWMDHRAGGCKSGESSSCRVDRHHWPTAVLSGCLETKEPELRDQKTYHPLSILLFLFRVHGYTGAYPRRVGDRSPANHRPTHKQPFTHNLESPINLRPNLHVFGL